MKLIVDGLEVLFPYSFIYPEQYAYMVALKRGLDAGGPVVLEMPSGTGKTVTLLAFITSYLYAHPQTGPLVYCSRTVGEVEKVMEELRRVVRYRENVLGKDRLGRFLGLALSARRNLCIHPDVVAHASSGAAVDTACRAKTASFLRAEAGVLPDLEDLAVPGSRPPSSSHGNAGCSTCDQFGCTNRNARSAEFAHTIQVGEHGLCHYYEAHEKDGSDVVLDGVYSLDDLREVGRLRHWCPYFMARRLVAHAQVVVYTYPYLLDPKIADIVSSALPESAIAVFDEAHNIDNTCIEVLSVKLSGQALTQALGSINTLLETVQRMREDHEASAQQMAAERSRLISGRLYSRMRGLQWEGSGSAVLSEDRSRDPIPGNMRKAEHFLGLVRRLVYYLRHKLNKARDVKQVSSARFLENVFKRERIEARALRFVHDRYAELVHTLQITDTGAHMALAQVVDFATLVSTYHKGFLVIYEPIDSTANNPFFEPQLQFACLDAAIAFAPVLRRFRSVVITSGTLSPLDIYPKILNFKPAVTERFPMSVSRPCICPVMVTRGSDQVALTTRFEVRQDLAVVRNYGLLLTEMAACVPDGVVCFFTSYRHMEDVVAMWGDMGVLSQVLRHKLLFVETVDSAESSLALQSYRKACDRGRGAVLLAIARGKISEGIDFDHHYARAVILFGVPYVNTRNHVVNARLQFLQLTYQIKDAEFLTFDAMRHAAQCVGRVIRGKSDYGIMVFADKRFARSDKRAKLPHWVAERVQPAHLNLSTDMAVNVVREFLKLMGQPIRKRDMLGIALWTESELPASARPSLPSTDSNMEEEKLEKLSSS